MFRFCISAYFSKGIIHHIITNRVFFVLFHLVFHTSFRYEILFKLAHLFFDTHQTLSFLNINIIYQHNVCNYNYFQPKLF